MLATAEAYGLTFAVPPRDTAVGAALRDHGEFARPEVDFLLACAAVPAGGFLDVGANLGAISLPFAMQRPAWRVFAMEPHPGLYRLLRDNALRNGLTSVATLRAAAGDVSDMVSFPNPSLEHEGNYGDLGFHAPAAIVRTATQMVRLDDLEAADVRLVKIDVQGFEAKVLQGAPRLLEEVRPVWFIEASDQVEVRCEVVELLRRTDYELFWFYSPFVTALPRRGGCPEQPRLGDPNFVAVPRGQSVPWPLTRVAAADQKRPGQTRDYPYLARYGF